MKIGAQFYTIRDFCTTKDDLYESLKKVADIGYTTVQLSGVCEYDPTEMKAELDRLGLKCVLTHIPTERIENETLKVAQDHTILGCDHVGLGWYGFNAEGGENKVQQFIETYTEPSKILASEGKYFMYHNHAAEFKKVGKKTVMELLSEGMPKELMGFTLDTYWVQVGGADPADYIERLSGRVPVIHLKDCAYEQKMSVVGEGNINFDRVFKMAEAAGTKYMMVEQDNCNGEDPFECLRRSYEYLKACGFN